MKCFIKRLQLEHKDYKNTWMNIQEETDYVQ